MTAPDTITRLTIALADRYTIQRELGAGGMATVYLAQDLKHDRDVAIKVLHPDLGAALGGERFLSEIRTTARLQHPHILPLLDSGEADGLLYYVMPLVSGETLRARLERERQLPIDDAVLIAREVADALGYAHSLGVIHRDIKPENILLQNGHAVVADFGIALAVQTAGGARMTQTGLSLGTPQYMSPEQAMGERSIDARSDIYALGAVTYEMLIGEPPLTGPTAQAILAHVMSEAPRGLVAQRRTIPLAVEHATLRALEKLPADRWPSTEKFIEALLRTDRVLQGDRSANASRRGVPTLAVIAVGAVVIASGAWYAARATAQTSATWSRFTQLTDASGVETSPTFSPDGESFAYASDARGTLDLYVHRVGGRNPQLIAGDSTVDENWPAWSPDGKQIAFSKTGDGIWVTGATGESTHRLTTFGSMPSWSPDGAQIVFGGEEVFNPYLLNTLGEIYYVRVSGGEPTRIHVFDENHDSTDRARTYQPTWSPSGKRIAFFMVAGGQRDIATVPAEGGAAVRVTNDIALDWAPEWSADGRTLYFASDRGGAMGLWRIAIDESSGSPSGEPEYVAAGGDAWFDLPKVSRDSKRVIFRAKVESANPAAVSFDASSARIGESRLLQHRTGSLLPTSVSPDGQWLALMSALDRSQDVWVMRRDGRDLRRVTDDVWRDWSPRFTPDGKALTFYSNRLGRYQSFQIEVDGSNLVQLTDFTVGSYFAAFATDGRRLMMSAVEGGTRIAEPPWPATLARTTSVGPTTLSGRNVSITTWSPDSRWMSGYLDLPSGETRGHVVINVSTGDARVLNDDSNGYAAEWLPDSRHLVYFTRSHEVVIQDVITLERRVVQGVLPGAPDVRNSLVLAPDGRTLFYAMREVEANIWMVERAKAR